MGLRRPKSDAIYQIQTLYSMESGTRGIKSKEAAAFKKDAALFINHICKCAMYNTLLHPPALDSCTVAHPIGYRHYPSLLFTDQMQVIPMHMPIIRVEIGMNRPCMLK